MLECIVIYAPVQGISMNDSNTRNTTIPPNVSVPEFTFKSIVLAIILALVLSASNAYLALKIGTTISASIPASVLAIGLLRFFKRSNVLESNMIQTAASSGEGVAAAISFVLPAMIISGGWNHFPYWQTCAVTLMGGILGALFSIPLRRVLLGLNSLRFPEGTAVGNVLKASTRDGENIKLISKGGLVGALVSLFQSGFQVFSSTLQMWTFVGKSVLGFGWGFSPATLACGYIVGFEVGMSLLAGAFMGWLVVLPLLGWHQGISQTGTPYDAAMALWSDKLRYVGVGTMLVGGLWTLLNLFKPIAEGLKFSYESLLHNQPARKILRTERDIPIKWVLAGTLFITLLFFIYIFLYLRFSPHLAPLYLTIIVSLCTAVFMLVVGFLLATISGYFCGLVGSSNNPLSGLLITVILLISILYLLLFSVKGLAHTRYLISAVIIVTTVLAGIGSISGENIQDLKAGQMVGATPWRQQLMLIIGVVASSLVIGPVLQLLFNAYGMGGVYPRSGMSPSQMLTAPQAGLMAAVAKGVLMRQMNWNMLLIGAAIALFTIIVDELLKRRNYRLPTLAVGLGIYLPPEIITPIVIGGAMSLLVKRPWRNSALTRDQHKKVEMGYQRGILVACGMVAGSALMGVLLAIPFVIMGSADALSLVPKHYMILADVLGVGVFIALCYWFYRFRQ